MSAYAMDHFGRFDVSSPAAAVPALLLTPDGRYCCDGCDAVTDRAALTATAPGYYCLDCAPHYTAQESHA